ncbi:ATP-binding protein [Tropicimonas sp. TH_r6]|uniref:ATP-binding protein n=1 Tax=Tropicimonas sp. TH_r6 TaxID=3082085 RepID=UPI0029554B0E|nr:ATP-binding protein [Tropicimonas sp. TH_r6]MDV7143622.1 ATP-binding protein [Tropicimonas sp. TH_r6]
MPIKVSHALTRVVGSTPEDVRATLKRVAEDLGRLGVSESDREAVEVVLAECMNNVVEHAYCENPNGEFELKLCLTQESLFCRVEDRGKPMPGLAIPTGDQHDLSVDLDELPEGGFGWFLIRELTQDLNYSREADRNSLSFNISLGQSE